MSEPHQESILIVDDVQPNLRLLCDILAKTKYRLRPFFKPLAALESALEDPADLYLLDISMPEMDGYELCKALKAQRQTRDAPVVFISASTETESIVEGFHHGAVDYVAKPFQPEEVLSRIETHLELQRVSKRLARQNKELGEALASLKETKSQLIHSEKMASLGTLTAGIAHEINNPISFVLANSRILEKRLAQLLETQKPLDTEEHAEWHEMVEGMIDGSERIAEIVASLQTYSRHDERSQKSFDPRQNIEATLRMFRHEIGQDIELKVDIQDPPQAIQANAGQINQVIANLISNAIAALRDSESSRNRQLSVTAKHKESVYAITVGDNGPGISAGDRNRIFEPFFTTKPPGSGLGLGLSIATNIMQQHQGKLEVESSSQGTQFTATLPYAAP